MSIPIVVVVRDPDYANEFHTFGDEVETHDIDLGSADLDNVDEFLDWAQGQLSSAQAILDKHGEGPGGQAASLIRSTVEEHAPDGILEGVLWLAATDATLGLDWQQILDIANTVEQSVCRHCQRAIVRTEEGWINPDATGDDSIWRETCENHNTMIAEHEPTEAP